MSETPVTSEALPDGWRLVVLEEVDSTNEEIRRRAVSDPGEGLCVAAKRQTAGRGRRGRTWESPPGNLFLSVRLAQARTVAETAQLSFVAALALGDALAEAAPHVPVRFKWPNDLLVNGAKLSGILLETHDAFVILGIGLNVAWAPAPAPGPAGLPATSLRAEGAHLAPEDLVGRICHHLHACVDLWRRAGFDAIRRGWLEKAQGIGQPVVARLQSGDEISGRFVDLDADGALVLELASGEHHRVLAGDVFFVAARSQS